MSNAHRSRREPSLSTLLEENTGVIGVVLGTVRGELRGMVGKVGDGDAGAAGVAALIHELSAIGKALGLGELGVSSLKAPTATRMFARRADAVLAIELDPRSPLGPVEQKLQTLAWTPEDVQHLALQRAPTATRQPRGDRTTSKPYRPADAAIEHDRASTSGASSPVFTGELDEFDLPNLLEFLRNSQRTGLLTCTTSHGTGTIQLSRGMIASASSPNALDLREHLLSSPDIAAEQRRALADLPIESFRDDIVNCAVSRELVAHSELERVRVARIQSAVREMIGWTSGRFSFDPGAPILPNPALVLSSQTLLLRIYQEQDEEAPR